MIADIVILLRDLSLNITRWADAMSDAAEIERLRALLAECADELDGRAICPTDIRFARRVRAAINPQINPEIKS